MLTILQNSSKKRFEVLGGQARVAPGSPVLHLEHGPRNLRGCRCLVELVTHTPLSDKIDRSFVEGAVLREHSAEVLAHDLGGLFQVLANCAVALLQLHRGDLLRVGPPSS